MKQVTKILGSALGSLSLMAGSAHASNMILVVPVEITDLPPDVHTARLECTLFSSTGREMDRSTTSIPLHNGGHSGQVRVDFRPSGYPASANPIDDMARYSCRMSFNWSCTSGTSAEGLCEWRPWYSPGTGSPGNSLFVQPSGSAVTYDLADEFDPDLATELPRRFR